ncbi:MAG: alcohol dehydrogenase catalytic domain-containing protein [Actinobacteria bacterium]|nr:alcohol dehydrogenase catalytic domain-containing protein [Actinomycetota bacterium]MBU1943172.1 alcohol dehydrogenase catalytic domain-containing protein [Actinomycetota bacterium]MBU2687850.1 alcohol dehydrogenase catalytic domain-containing protein [Actinomycetota bacterium]
MRAVQYRFSMPRYGYLKVAGRLRPTEFYGPRSIVSLVDVPEPVLRGPKWVKLRSVLSGFCGSDLGAILLHDSPTTEPFAAFPFTLGHENCSIVEEVGSAVTRLKPGDRVTVLPPLGCEAREIDPPCPSCARGEVGLCQNFAEGALRPGIDVGFSADTGGGWSKYYQVPECNVVRVPESFSDLQVALIESLCSSLHQVMRVRPREGERVLVVGCGVIGLGVIASIRALDIDCHVTGIEPHPLNQGKAREKGADEIIDPCRESIYERTVEITGAHLYKPTLEKPICMGGFDVIFDCVGSTDTINTSLRVAASMGRYALIGITIPKRIDWAPVWMKGLTIVGCHAEGVDEYKGGVMGTFDVAIDLIAEGKVDLSDLVTHTFTLDEYVEAIKVNMDKAGHNAIKTIFDLTGE